MLEPHAEERRSRVSKYEVAPTPEIAHFPHPSTEKLLSGLTSRRRE